MIPSLLSDSVLPDDPEHVRGDDDHDHQHRGGQEELLHPLPPQDRRPRAEQRARLLHHHVALQHPPQAGALPHPHHLHRQPHQGHEPGSGKTDV